MDDLGSVVPQSVSADGSASPGSPEGQGRHPVEFLADGESANGAAGDPPFAAWIRGAMGYVPTAARRYFGCGLPFEELIAAGNLGLVEAALRFDPSRNVKFVTYADWWIRKAILTAIEDQAGPVRLPRYRLEQFRTLHDVRATLRGRTGQEPEVEALSQASGLSVEDIKRLLATSRQSVSLDQPPDAEDERPLHDTLASVASRGPLDELLAIDVSHQLRRAVASLDLRTQAVLTLRYGLGGASPLTLREVGRRLGVSRERVRQVERRALDYLRRRLKER